MSWARWRERHHAPPLNARWRPGGVVRYMRARLHRRIFAWFGASIVVTALGVLAVSIVVEHTVGSGFRSEVARVQAFLGNQVAEGWEDAASRDRFLGSLGRDLDAAVTLRDRSGAILYGASPACDRPLIVPVKRAEAPLGDLAICFSRAHRSGPLWLVLTLGVVGAVLWASAGHIARRLARPLGELARVAQDIGRGQLASRVKLTCFEHGEVGLVAESMNDMAARIQRQLEEQRELLATVSHELRTPLSRIRLLTEIARDGGEPGRAFDEIDQEVVEIDALVGELLASSRLDFSALHPVDLVAADAARRAVERSGLDPAIVCVEGAEEALVHADATVLARALANLLDNAKRHAGGATRVRVRDLGPEVAFDVEDDGPGLLPEDTQRIFEPFFQGGRRAEGKSGTLGLGLSLVKRIAEAHGGRAFAENREDRGARIGFVLPKEAPAASEKGETQAQESGGWGAETSVASAAGLRPA